MISVLFYIYLLLHLCSVRPWSSQILLWTPNIAMSEILSSLRSLMASHSPPLDALVVPSEDYHQVWFIFNWITLFWFMIRSQITWLYVYYYLIMYCSLIWVKVSIFKLYVERVCFCTRQTPWVRVWIQWKCRSVSIFYCSGFKYC